VKPPAGPPAGQVQARLPSERLRKRVFSLPTLIATAVAGVLLALVLWRAFDINWSEFWDNARDISPASYLAALLAYYVSFWFRGLRWRLIALTAFRARVPDGQQPQEPPPHVPGVTTLGGIILMGWFANSVAFLRVGDAYRGWALSRESGAGFGQSLGTVLAERVQDIFAVLVLILAAAAWVTAEGETEAPAWVIIGAFVLAGVLVALLLAMRLFGLRLASRLPPRVAKAYAGFQHGTLGSFSARELPLQLALGMTGWLLEIARFYFVAKGLGLEISFGVVMLAALANALLSTIPTPGGFGFVESGLTGMLILVGLDDTTAFSLTVVDRTISWVSVVVFGGLLFAYWHLVRDRRFKARRQPQADEPRAPQGGSPGGGGAA
jgi:uncharacterized protein (TIRG00374 family)